MESCLSRCNHRCDAFSANIAENAWPSASGGNTRGWRGKQPVLASETSVSDL